MKVLVTGAAGFIGSHLVDRLLEEGEEVIGVDDLSSGALANLADARSAAGKFSFQRADVTSTVIGDLVKRTQPEVICHLAAQVDVRASVANPVQDAMVNVIGTVNVLAAASQAGVRKVIVASSGGTIYGDPEPSRLPITEDQFFRPESMPVSPYGVSKRVITDYLRYFQVDKGLDYTALALANVYGPRQEPASEVGLEGQVVAIFARRMLGAKPCTIYGDGTQTRDFAHVHDVVSAFMAARDQGSAELINIGSGSEISINELYAKLATLTDARFEPTYAPWRPGELYRIAIAPTKAADVLGWKPSLSIDEGLAQTVDWFRAKGGPGG